MTASRIKSVLILFFLLLLLVFFIPLFIQSFGWYQLVDSPVLNYVSFLMIKGRIIYKDIFDINLPGSYWIHIFIERFIGYSDYAFRLADLSFLLIICLSIYLILKPSSSLLAFFCSLIFASIHLAGGPADMLERDYILLPFIGLGTYLFFISMTSDKRHYLSLILSGILFGYATIIKPSVPFLALTFSIFYFFYFYNLFEIKKLLYHLFVFYFGLLLFPVFLLFWLYHKGALPYFVDIFKNYLPIFYQNRHDSYKNIILSMFITPIGPMLFIVFLLIPFYPYILNFIKRNFRYRILFFLLCLGILYGFVSYFVQGTIWPYHLYPLYYYLLTTLFLVLIILIKSDSFYFISHSIIYFFLITLFSSFLLFRTYEYKSDYINQYYGDLYHQPVQSRVKLVNQLVYDLSKVVCSGDTVEVYDNTQEGDNILYRLKLYTPTRFVQEIHYSWGFIDSNRYIHNIWLEYFNTFKLHPPKAIVVFSSSKVFHYKILSNLKYFRSLFNFIRSHYVLYKKNTYYYILIRKY